MAPCRPLVSPAAQTDLGLAGADPVEVEQTLAHIAMGQGSAVTNAIWTPSRAMCPATGSMSGASLPAVISIRGGRCWGGDRAAALKSLLKAVRYYSIASYPHLKHDELADQAQLLGNMAYREAGRLFKVPLKELQVPFRARPSRATCICPPPRNLCPWSSSAVASIRFRWTSSTSISSVLEPHGIGMLSLDMPGTGYAEHWPLVQDTSRLHQAVLNYLSEVAWVDHQRIAMVGFRLAGNGRPASPSSSRSSFGPWSASVPASTRCSPIRRCSPAARA